MPTTTRTLAAALAVFAAVPTAAVAAPRNVPAADVSRYTAVVRAINPTLPLGRARLYATSVLADAVRTRLDPRFLMAIVTVESGWRAEAVSRTGARGLGQLMPSTARTLRVNAWDPTDNLRGTSHYLAGLMQRFAAAPDGKRLAIAAYNAGPHAVQRYRGIPPFAETQRYVVKVLRTWNALIARVAPPGLRDVAIPEAVAARDERMWLAAARAHGASEPSAAALDALATDAAPAVDALPAAPAAPAPAASAAPGR